MSRKELQELVKERKIDTQEPISSLNKEKMIALLNENDLIEKTEDNITNIVSLGISPGRRKANQPLSRSAEQWLKHFANIKITPEIFLERYPLHPHREQIEEVKNYLLNQKAE